MGRNPCCPKEDLNRGAWTSHEDQILTDYIETHGQGKWRELPEKAGLKRCGKSCRLRWLNYLRPDIKRGNITPDEEELIIKLHKLLGNKWSLIAGRLPGRTDNEIKNYWNTNLGKRVEGSTTTTTLQRNQSRKKKYTMAPSNEADETSPKAKPVQVVRTKAHRCKKLFLPPKPEKGVHGQEVELKSYSAFHPYSQSEEYYRPSFMTDLNMGDFCLSGLLDSDFSRLSYFHKESRGFDGNTKSSINNNVSVTSAPTVLFNGGMFDDWRTSDCVQYSDQSSSDLHSIASFLDPEEGWLLE